MTPYGRNGGLQEFKFTFQALPLLQHVSSNWYSVIHNVEMSSTTQYIHHLFLPDSKYTEMALETWINREAASCRIHTGHILTLMNVFQCQFVTIIPMTVVKVLTD